MKQWGRVIASKEFSTKYLVNTFIKDVNKNFSRHLEKKLTYFWYMSVHLNGVHLIFVQFSLLSFKNVKLNCVLFTVKA